MPRRPAKITQADIARAIKAAKRGGASSLTVDGDGVIRIGLVENQTPIQPAIDLEEVWTPSEALKRHLRKKH